MRELSAAGYPGVSNTFLPGFDLHSGQRQPLLADQFLRFAVVCAAHRLHLRVLVCWALDGCKTGPRFPESPEFERSDLRATSGRQHRQSILLDQASALAQKLCVPTASQSAAANPAQ